MLKAPIYVTDADGISFSAWLTHGIACAPGDMAPEEVERRVRALDLAGTEMGWRLGEEPAVICAKDPAKKHHLMVC